MTLDAFRQLQPIDKVQLVVAAGTHLAQRQQNQQVVHLYFLPNSGVGIFVEISYEPALEAIVVICSFTDVARLADDYMGAISLPPL